jgi:hypothetical protein
VRDVHERLLSRLELVPEDFDWLLAIERALAGRLRAFYDPELATIFVDRALVGSRRRHALLHELVHALQDQHHALGARLAYVPDAWDRRSALHALAEGDAEALVAQLTLPTESTTTSVSSAESSAALAASWPDTPGVLWRSLAAVYEDGRAFVDPVLAAGGWSAVDALFADPPRTTHELLHGVSSAPQPLSVAHAASPGPDWTLVYSDVLGEQTWRIVLEEWLPESAARRVASSWAGDRLSAFDRPGATALAWELRFDIPAQGILEAVRKRFRAPTHRGEVAQGLSRNPFECRAHRDEGVVATQADGPRLWLLSLTDQRTDAACHALAQWATQLKRVSQAETRVGSASSVRSDPGRQNVSIPPE